MKTTPPKPTLTRKEFDVLSTIAKGTVTHQRGLAESCGLSLGTVNGLYRSLCAQGFMVDFQLTDAGWAALEPYRVDNAVILAAGLSSRFAPISYEKPKGVLRVRGEVLIERQIRQLQEAGITTIYVVVGYMKEEFFYLEDLLGVTILVNDAYATRNNNSTIHRVRHLLGNSYICSSDDYFTENPFDAYVYEAFYSGVYVEGKTEEWCLTTKGSERRITGVEIGGEDSWVMLGHAFWDRRFSQRFVEILEAEYNDPETASKLWEDIYLAHLRELPMVMRPYKPGIIWEFDSLDELRAFDPTFIDNVDSSILDNISRVLKCSRSSIREIVPLKQGLSNLSFRFSVNGSAYVYRHPGVRTNEPVNRAIEAEAEEIASRLGLDSTYIYENPREGWKLSHYRARAKPLDYQDEAQVKTALDMMRTLHRSNAALNATCDVFQETQKFVELLKENRRTTFREFSTLLTLAESMDKILKSAHGTPVLCHNNLTPSNFLVTPTQATNSSSADNDQRSSCGESKRLLDIIDWEYAAMGDYAVDLAIFLCSGDFTYREIDGILERYFGRPLSQKERIHHYAALCVASFYWFIWALYEESQGRPVGETQLRWYKFVKHYGAETRALL